MEPNWLRVRDPDAADGGFGGERGFAQIECFVRDEAPGNVFL